MINKNTPVLVPEAEQPYPVPKNWCWVRLGTLYEINPKNIANDDTLAGFVPMEKISQGLTSDFTYVTQPWGIAKKGHTQIANGDVAFAKISPCFENRKSFIVKNLPNGIGGGTTELVVLRQPAVNQTYTFWMLSDERFISGGKRTYSGTVGQQRISMDYVRNYTVPLPPYPEQGRIVARIESLFSKLNEAQKKIQNVVDGYGIRKTPLAQIDLIKKSILAQAFRGQLGTNDPTEESPEIQLKSPG